jgi:CheY-like chemotaxis protein
MRTINLLQIEDNEGDLTLTKEALSELDFVIDVTTATDGQKGLDYLRERINNSKKTLTDLIILDINLNIITGFEILEHIKSSTSLRHIPVIIFSTSSHNNYIKTAYKLYANCFVTKPMEVVDFFNSIKNIIEFWTKTATFES